MYFNSYMTNYGIHSQKYPFPTRRSSDLESLANLGGILDGIQTVELERAARRAEHGRQHLDGRRLPGAVGDRKSTRLNSSHGYISYAVFCLKKKNIQL